MAHSLAQNLFDMKRVSERYLVSSPQRDGQPLKQILRFNVFQCNFCDLPSFAINSDASEFQGPAVSIAIGMK